SLLGIGGPLRQHVTARAQYISKQRHDARDVAGSSKWLLLPGPCRTAVANQFVQTHRNRLAQVHRDVLFPGGNANQPVAIAEVILGEPVPLRAKQEGHWA